MIKIIEKEQNNSKSTLKVKLFEERAKKIFETVVKQQIENAKKSTNKPNNSFNCNNPV